MSDLSKKARKLIDDVTSETTNAWDEYGLSPAEYDLWQAVDPMRSTGSHKPHGNGSSLLASLCDEIDALEKENAEMRAKLSATDPISVLDAACRTSGIPLADDYEQRLAEWRAYVDAPVDPADLDSAIYRAMAADPKAYPPEKP